MLQMIEKGIRVGRCQTIHRCAKENNKYMKNYVKNIEAYLIYLHANNWYGWAMSQKLPVNGFKWVRNLSKFNEHFIKNYDENSNKTYFIEVDDEYPKKLFSLHSDIPFLRERKKIKKCNVSNIQDKENYVAHIRALKQALNHGLIFFKKSTQSNSIQSRRMVKTYIDMNTKLRTEAKNDFNKDFFKLTNNAVLGKTMENVRKHKDIKLVTTDKRRNQLD